MRTLVVEDDENKRRQVMDYLAAKHPEVAVEHSGSLVSGLRKLKEKAFDLVILDMTLPNYETSNSGSTRMHAFGGREFLRQMARAGLHGKAVVLTQFESFGETSNLTFLPDLDAELRNKYKDVYLGAIYYHASQSEWTGELTTIIGKLSEKI
ncbi:response regulator [Mesorhizobium sp. CO1-1-8]|uniref:response regulator n=1 Tax=Mesorhizobium sp. CO1-1-8 TaxID=2876631 RepID=UPI001CD0CED9|nr:response regulator [Mesorhizobium sp. CO1-1-8]MBZ9775379.1 response regulator [Mesorhizobium sp. CO1-1-8]